MNSNESKLQRCLQLAKLGLGTTYPNPLVGCVIVHKNKIIGEGWHQKAGENHAEINAIESVKNKDLLSESTLYVNLEPCSHFGKTPPCSHAIVKHKIPRVVIGTTDFSSHVNGQGISYLKNHGIEVTTNVLVEECLHLNRRFFTNQLKKRPYIILKWAQTANAYFSPEDDTQRWITSINSKQIVHFWRSQENGILVGRKTLCIDQPQLNIRLWRGENPQKLYLSSQNDIPTPAGFKNIMPPHTPVNAENLEKALKETLSNGVNSLIIEGGATTLQSFIDFNLWDEARVITSPNQWTTGKKAPKITNTRKEIHTHLPNQETLITYFSNELPVSKH